MSSSLNIEVRQGQIVLDYSPFGDPSWFVKKLLGDGETVIQKTFSFTGSDLITPSLPLRDVDEEGDSLDFTFSFGVREGEYYRIEGRKLRIPQDVYVAIGFDLEIKHFVAPRKVSIFRKLAKLTEDDVYIGGGHEFAIPEMEFGRLVRGMPNDSELDKYVLARVGSVLTNYLETVKDAEAAYQSHRNRRDAEVPRLLVAAKANEISKFVTLESKLTEMLAKEATYSELRWQEEIVDLLLLLYPKYVKAFREGPIRDRHAKKRRRVDFILMDASGNVDVLEIKKPESKAIMTGSKFRDNHIPRRSLSGTVMQVEKYLYHLVRSGELGLKELNRRHGKDLPAGIELKVTNPCGLVLLGRDNDLTNEQRLDFEIVRRHYKNIVDVITYDDLLRRFRATLAILNG